MMINISLFSEVYWFELYLNLTFQSYDLIIIYFDLHVEDDTFCLRGGCGRVNLFCVLPTYKLVHSYPVNNEFGATK